MRDAYSGVWISLDLVRPASDGSRSYFDLLFGNRYGVEMEVAGFYAFAQVRDRAVACLACATKQIGNINEKFEKG